MLLNCFCTAGYVLVVRFQGRSAGNLGNGKNKGSTKGGKGEEGKGDALYGEVLKQADQNKLKSESRKQADDTTKALCNALVALPLFGLLAAGSGEVSRATQSPLLLSGNVDLGLILGVGVSKLPYPDPAFAGAVLLSGFLSFLLGVACFTCIQATSPTTMSIAVRIFPFR